MNDGGDLAETKRILLEPADRRPMSRTPVLLFVYNRLHTTAQVFDSIAAERPAVLLVVADGPRPDRPDDVAQCDAVRELVSNPKWNCDLRLNFAASNLGFNRRISSGLAWAFSLFEEVIILEDDCVPHPTFFPFCDDLLERCRFDDRVMMISGCNFQFGRKSTNASYYFSHGVGTWGWASWRRALRHFDPEMRAWPFERQNGMLNRVWPVDDAVEYWRARLDEAYGREVDAWDYQWAFTMWQRGGLQVAPNANLISYIGCLPDTAHTTNVRAPYCNVPRFPMEFPLRHPSDVHRDLRADLFEFYKVFLDLEDDEAERRSTLQTSAGRRAPTDGEPGGASADPLWTK